MEYETNCTLTRISNHCTANQLVYHSSIDKLLLLVHL